ncbi:MAG: cob(I)yrinic acid a,c-diamide adenosyltransferase [Spirochaetia bacterium]|nr:cob(I)yrinic acid a,c-diamide adenosyltransferase [Spirochaetia bacterium]
MKIYTKKGDSGQTQLASGEHVRKSHERVDLYGTVDELNSCMGAAAAFFEGAPLEETKREFEQIQSLLFELGSELAGWKGPEPAIREDDVIVLERSIDRMTSGLAALKHFILPGGTKGASLTHVARSVCRRLERMMTDRSVDAGAYKYINRLSDYLFTVARYANASAGVADISWKSRQK